ncbi:MAG TPA: ATP-grasp domain-containing protein [Anaerolineae bacterium]|nr:ATP-grasp domain-containing protein [Anaerolineae bacterium]
MSQPITVLFLATEYKGAAVVRECKAQGCHVILITEEEREHEPWPREAIHDFFMMPDLSDTQAVMNGVSYLARDRAIDVIIALDDYDVEMAATLREHLRLSGMGSTLVRYFRDKLAMRGQAAAGGVRVPGFTGIFNYDKLREFMANTPPPWVLKPRAEAGAVGIRKLNEPEELWRALDELGDLRSYHLLEDFVPGDIYHVDSITYGGEVKFAIVHKYGRPPLSVSHDGGVFSTRTLPRDGDEAKELLAINANLLKALQMKDGVTHAEFIRGHADGQLYFLEIGARVGGANIAETVEFASGINLWQEWARVELARARNEDYNPPADKGGYAGIIICLAKQKRADLSGYQDPEVVWRLEKDYHAGLIIASQDPTRIENLLNDYTDRFGQDFLAVGPKETKIRTFSN